jgi:hypothetical protein
VLATPESCAQREGRREARLEVSSEQRTWGESIAHRDHAAAQIAGMPGIGARSGA